MAAPNDLCWLTAPTRSASSVEKLEYRVKGPLAAASAILSRRSSEITGELEASFPLMKKWKQSLEVRLGTESCPFEIYREITSTKTIEWSYSDEGLFVDQKLSVDADQMSLAAAPIIAAPQLVFSLAEAESAECAGYFVAGRKIFAIRTSRGTEERTARASVVEIDHQDLGRKEFANLKWDLARDFEMNFSDDKRIPESFRVKLAPFGAFEARLSRYELA